MDVNKVLEEDHSLTFFVLSKNMLTGHEKKKIKLNKKCSQKKVEDNFDCFHRSPKK